MDIFFEFVYGHVCDLSSKQGRAKSKKYEPLDK